MKKKVRLGKMNDFKYIPICIQKSEPCSLMDEQILTALFSSLCRRLPKYAWNMKKEIWISKFFQVFPVHGDIQHL